MKLNDSNLVMTDGGRDVNPENAPDPQESAIETAEELREDLEALAASDLPFAYDAEQILHALDQANSEEGSNR